MISCIIDRPTWYRGQGGHNSKLLQPNGERCCIGFLAAVLGVPDDVILNIAVLDGLAHNESVPVTRFLNHVDCQRNTHGGRPHPLTHAYDVNDDPTLSDTEREASLLLIGREMGVEFSFVHDSRPNDRRTP